MPYESGQFRSGEVNSINKTPLLEGIDSFLVAKNYDYLQLNTKS